MLMQSHYWQMQQELLDTTKSCAVPLLLLWPLCILTSFCYGGWQNWGSDGKKVLTPFISPVRVPSRLSVPHDLLHDWWTQISVPFHFPLPFQFLSRPICDWWMDWDPVPSSLSKRTKWGGAQLGVERAAHLSPILLSHPLNWTGQVLWLTTAIIYPRPLPNPFVKIEMGQDGKSNGTGMGRMNGLKWPSYSPFFGYLPKLKCKYNSDSGHSGYQHSAFGLVADYRMPLLQPEIGINGPASHRHK